MSDKTFSREDIYQYTQDAMVRLFEVNPNDITPEAQLYQDLDIDSIDAIDLIVELDRWAGRKIPPESFKSVRTVQDVVDAVDQLLNH